MYIYTYICISVGVYMCMYMYVCMHIHLDTQVDGLFADYSSCNYIKTSGLRFFLSLLFSVSESSQKMVLLGEIRVYLSRAKCGSSNFPLRCSHPQQPTETKAGGRSHLPFIFNPIPAICRSQTAVVTPFKSTAKLLGE